MTRLLAEHFKADGTPKRAYADRALAVAAVGKGRQHVYRCKFCGAWHRASGGKATSGEARWTTKELIERLQAEPENAENDDG